MDINENMSRKLINCNNKIVQLNANINSTSVPYRLKQAFDKVGIASKIITMQSSVCDEDIVIVKPKYHTRVLRKIDHIFLEMKARVRYKRNEGMPFTYYHVGMNVSANKFVRLADIIIIHWIGGTFLSMQGIKKLMRLHKHIIIVCHDNWHFTGGCHVRLGCEGYKSGCGMCPQLCSVRKNDWSYKLCKKKKNIYLLKQLVVISPSTWMNNNVLKSDVFQGKRHYIIPNPIDIELYKPVAFSALREELKIPLDTKILAFGAVNADTSPYKGYSQLMQALKIYESTYLNDEKLVVLIFGSKEKKHIIAGKIDTYYLGYLSEHEMVQMYNTADVYVVPSLEDSFNNTVAESLACETPVVAFATGGIVDIIDHKVNGYLAQYNNPLDLTEGINWVLNNNEKNQLGRAGRLKVKEKFSSQTVTEQYLELFSEILENRNEEGKI